jgi:stearoyl-CoA desaturase (delta-9 desaturase)
MVSQSWHGALNGLLWGGAVRIFLVQHVNFANGSFSHMYGGRPFDNGDQSANNMVFVIPTFGSAYQNNHHAFPTSAQIGLRWWQPDIGYMFINVFKLMGLASNIKKPTREQIEGKSCQAQASDRSQH